MPVTTQRLDFLQLRVMLGLESPSFLSLPKYTFPSLGSG